jgi:hypothetical protein
VRVTDPGDTEFLEGETVNRIIFQDENSPFVLVAAALGDSIRVTTEAAEQRDARPQGPHHEHLPDVEH